MFAPTPGQDWATETGGPSLLGFGGHAYHGPNPRDRYMGWLPGWFPVVVTLVPPAAWRYRRKRRGARGFPIQPMEQLAREGS